MFARTIRLTQLKQQQRTNITDQTRQFQRLLPCGVLYPASVAFKVHFPPLILVQNSWNPRFCGSADKIISIEFLLRHTFKEQ